MKNKFTEHFGYKGRRKKGDTASLAAQLAPLEEQDAHAARKQGANARNKNNGNSAPIQDHGALIIDNDTVRLPKGFVEGGRGENFLGIEPVVLVIVIIALMFTAFIAWQISGMTMPG